MIHIRRMFSAEKSDTELVAQTLVGNRDAFGQIVERYQTLVCSLAYSATGSFTRSEDLSQETFLAAWRQLPELREPGKLRSWLCGIVRNLSHRALREQLREPVHGAHELDAAHETPAIEPLPSDQAISREEEAILWRSLERIPENYREPLVLFYREHQSIERVARVLDLPEDVVRQRLSRGRKLLEDEVASFVEGALRQSAPGPAFAASVLAALPINPVGLGAAAGAAKGGGLISFLTVPVIGLFASLAGSIGIIRDAATPGERQSKKRLIGAMWIDGAGLWAALFLSRFLRKQWSWSDPAFVDVQVGCYLVWAAILAPLVVVYIRRFIAIPPETAPAALPWRAAKPKLSVLLTNGAMTIGALAGFIHLEWQVGDFLSAGITAATGLAVIAGFIYFQRWFGRTRAFPAGWAWAPTVSIVGVILLTVNWRLDRWIAVIMGSDLTKAHLFLPMWIVHLSTLLILVWIGAVVSITKPKGANLDFIP